jgi:hypothetical protein
MKAGGALLHQPFPLLVPFAPECRLTLGETIGGVWLTLDDPGLTIIETDLHSSVSAHGR